MPLHMIKLVVGVDTIDDLLSWRRQTKRAEPEWKVRTRQTPKRAEELVDGGSLYRVIKGVVVCRQRILRVETVGEGPAARCEITVDPEVVRTSPAARRPFQGWRYLEPKDAPEDLVVGEEQAALPTDLVVRLREIGAW
ncbi:MAG: hypothetical protein B7Y99_05805 [Caulobacterales bacterium 32-69-10]|nr:MAG: hypothetical protein B7Y99_05805 [Caulobacterales bacterium 32-69-10]